MSEATAEDIAAERARRLSLRASQSPPNAGLAGPPTAEDAALGQQLIREGTVRVGRRDAETPVEPSPELPGPVRALRAALHPSVSLGLAGSVAGGLYGGPAGARAGGVVGTGIGTSLDKVIDGEDVLSMRNLKDTAFNMGLSYGGDIVAGKIANLASGQVGKVGNRVRAKIFGEAAEGAEDMHQVGKEMSLAAQMDVGNVLAEGGVPIPADDLNRAMKGIFNASELMESQALDQATAVASGSFIGSSAVRKLKVIQERVVDAYKTAYKRAVGPYYGDAGKLSRLLGEKIERFSQGQRGIASSMHERVHQLAGNTPVDISPIANNLDETLTLMDKIRGANPDIEGTDAIVRSAREIQNRFLGQMSGQGYQGPVPFTWDEAKQLRTMYRELAEKVGKAGHRSAASDARKIVRNLTEVMESSLDDVAPVDAQGRTLRGLWKRANAKTRAVEELTEKAQLQSVIELADEAGVGAAVAEELAPKMATAAALRRVRFMLGGANSREWQALRRWRVEGMFNTMSPKRALSVLTEVQPVGAGPEAYKELLGPYYDNAVKFFRAVNFASKANPAGSKVAPHLIETGLVLALPGAVKSGLLSTAGAGLAGGSYVVGMRTLSRWLTSPKTADMALGLVQPAKWPKSKMLFQQAARAIELAIAESAIGTDDIQIIPQSASREEIRAMRLHQQQPATYGGTRG